jgi:hypothetical protein
MANGIRSKCAPSLGNPRPDVGAQRLEGVGVGVGVEVGVGVGVGRQGRQVGR